MLLAEQLSTAITSVLVLFGCHACSPVHSADEHEDKDYIWKEKCCLKRPILFIREPKTLNTEAENLKLDIFALGLQRYPRSNVCT